MSERKRVLRNALACFLMLLILTTFLAVLFLPDIFGVEWIIGWPEFLAKSLSMVGTFLLWVLIQEKVYVSKKAKQDPTKKQKRFTIISLLVMGVMVIGNEAYSSFAGSRKVDHYMKSPNGKNTAVVISHDHEPESIYPVRKWFFYENSRDNSAEYIYPQYYDVTMEWLDDNTLEITRTWENDDGEIETETYQIRW